jgi:hypothetical protein
MVAEKLNTSMRETSMKFDHISGTDWVSELFFYIFESQQVHICVFRNFEEVQPYIRY